MAAKLDNSITLEPDDQIEIVSGEGENGTREEYDGSMTIRALKSRLVRERCSGDRWAYCEINGQRFE